MMPTILLLAAFCFAKESLCAASNSTALGLDLEKFMEENLICHNKYREKHGVKPLSYNDELNSIAAKYAAFLAEKDDGLVHSSNGLGENIYHSNGKEIDGFSGCNSWYDEIKDYNFDLDQPNNFQDVGHFSALVWKGSCFMGIGIATSKSGWTYVVANYDPAGNVEQKFRSNVFKPGTPIQNISNKSPFDQMMNEDKVICSDVNETTLLEQNLECQNMARKRHGVPLLSYSEEMNNFAQKQAESFANTSQLDNGNYGILVYNQQGGKKEGYSPCKSWYKGGQNYNYTSEENPSSTYSFTQMIWKSSNKTGFGLTRTEDGRIIAISVYDPPGNYKNEFEKNVLLPTNETSANISSTALPTSSSSEESGVQTRARIDNNKFRLQNLLCHNKYRKIHGVKPLTYSDQLNNLAQNYAEKLAARGGGLSHSSSIYAENHFSSQGKQLNGETACNFWYKESKYYNYGEDQPTNFEAVGHFTAMVWKGTCFTGFGVATSRSGRTFIVSLYNPAGNFENKFRTNVLEPDSPHNNSLSPFDSLMNDDPVVCSDVDRNAFQQQNLECHNIIRQRHGVPPLSNSNELNKYAQMQADSFSKTGKLTRNMKYGQNTYNSIGGNIEGYSPCKSWYQSGEGYDYNSEAESNSASSFTQMIWKSSQKVGIGMSRTSKGQLIAICVYYPPGNTGDFEKNVQPPGSETNDMILPPPQETRQMTEDPTKLLKIDVEKFKEQNLICHNNHRQHHGAKNLSYSDKMNKIAQRRADYLATRDKGLQRLHSGHVEYAENRYYSSGEVDGQTACEQWYSEVKYYDFTLEPRNITRVGHFTAMVWKATHFMGIGIATSKTGRTYIDALYETGNIKNQFKNNVQKSDTESQPYMSPFDDLMNDDKLVSTDADRETFLKQNLECHNIIRQRHQAPPLSYRKELNEYAQELADFWAETGAYDYSDYNGYGVNVYHSSGGKIHGYLACKDWYQSSENYDYNTESNTNSAPSFTQMVWKSSRVTGIGVARSSDGQLFVISVYDPPGNYIGDFENNVLPPDENSSALTTYKKQSNEEKEKSAFLSKFREENLICHNKHRQLHGVHNISYSKELNDAAQKHAEQLASNDKGPYSKSEFAENLFYSTEEISGYEPCNEWYAEVKNYNFSEDEPSNFNNVGHFTAMVWKGVCFMGIGYATSKNGSIYVVADYETGNIENQFKFNIQKPGTKSQRNMSSFDALMYGDKLVCTDADRETFLKQNLECHNIIRQRHQVPRLSYSNELNEFAQEEADKWARTGEYKYNTNNIYGQNMYNKVGGKIEGYSACKKWYQPSQEYDYDSEINSNSETFSQMVWKSSRITGIGVARSSNGQLYVVSVYDPPGNNFGEFQNNVFPPVANSRNPKHLSTATTYNHLSNLGNLKKPVLVLPTFREQNLICHNNYRKKHGSQPLTANEDLNDEAQSYAEYLASVDAGLQQSNIKDLGENLFRSSESVTLDGFTACDHWYREIKNYDFIFAQSSNGRKIPFAQMVWKSSREIGCGMSRSINRRVYFVCFYDPPGQVDGQFRENVLPAQQ